jgi:hypothetical protein
MDEAKSDRVPWLPRIALGAFGIGLASIAVGFFHSDAAGAWLRCGAVAWLIAYFIILADNFKRRLPVQTRRGVVRREDGALRYALPFIPLALIGLVALVVVLATMGS